MSNIRSRESEGYLLKAAKDSLTARVLINSFLAELYYFPYFIASNLAEKISIERHLNQLLNLKRARDEGHIEDWAIIWHRASKTNWPQTPERIRIFVPRGTECRDFVPQQVLNEIKRIRKSGLHSLQISDN